MVQQNRIMTDTVVDWMEPNEGDVLATLSRTGPEYGPVLAYQLDMDGDAFETTCHQLASKGVIERVSEEPLYRLTRLGSRIVDRDPGASTQRVAIE